MTVVIVALAFIVGYLTRDLIGAWKYNKLELAIVCQQDNIYKLQAALKESLAERARLVNKLAGGSE